MTLSAELQKERLKGVGGSEVPAILGIDKYSSPYKVWLSKTGQDTPEPENKFMRAGNILESAVAEYFALETNYRIIKSSAKPTLFQHPEHSFAQSIPDRFYIAKKKVGRGVLECKNTQMNIEDVINPWFCQLQWYLGVTGSIYGGIAWLIRGLDFRYKEYEFNSEFFDYLIGEVSHFWTENVLKNIAPDPISVEDVQKMYARSSEGKTVEATEEVLSAHARLTVLKDSIKLLETERDQLQDAIKVSMRDTEIIADQGYPLFTWKSSKPVKSFNSDSFKIVHPDIWDDYQIEKEGVRRFLIK